MLVPMYFLIAIWGHEHQHVRGHQIFPAYTQLSGLLMLAAILALYWMHFQATGIATFDYGSCGRQNLARMPTVDHARIPGGVFGEAAGVSVAHVATGCAHVRPRPRAALF